MNISTHGFNKLIGVVATAFVLAACSATPTIPEGAQNARSKLTALQADAELANRAPVEIKQAELAVSAAEVPQKDAALGNHLVLMADRTVDIARARAETRLLEDQRQMLGEQRSAARLDSRTREADRARADADSSRVANAELQRQIDELNARETNRGLVITLGDLMFATGKSDLMGGAKANLGKLAAFLAKYPDRSVIIEGHTDNVGSESYNMDLSQSRANSTRTYLVGQGVDAARISTSAMGETSPIADNASDTGRQQNRRVEIIISNPPVVAR